jgi:hypothetical protein
LPGNGKVTTQVDSGATLSAASIHQGKMTIGNGAKVVIRPLPGGPLGRTITPVPEPSKLFSFWERFLLLMCKWMKKGK